MPPGRIEDVIDVLAPLHRVMAAFQNELVGRAEGGLWMEGPLETFGGEVRLSLGEARLRGRRLGDGELRMRFVDGASLVLEPLVLEGALGRTSAQGAWKFGSGSSTIASAARGCRLGELVGPERAENGGLSAILALSGKVPGDTGTPFMSGWMHSPEVTFADRTLGPCSSRGAAGRRGSQIFGNPFRDANGTMGLHVGGDWPYEGTLNLAPACRRSTAAPGRRDRPGSLRVARRLGAREGLLLEPEQMKLPGTRGSARAGARRLPHPNDGDRTLAYEAGRWRCSPSPSRAGDRAARRGDLLRAKHGRALDGTLDVRLLESFVPRLERATGRLELSAVANGCPRQAGPQWQRGALLERGRGAWEAGGLSRARGARALRGCARLTAGAGRLNDGRVAATGEVTWEDFGAAGLTLEAELDHVAIRASPDIPFPADGRLTCRAPVRCRTRGASSR